MSSREPFLWKKYEIWADFGSVGNTENKIWADYEQLLKAVFFMFSGAKEFLFLEIVTCFICFTQKFSVVRRTEIFVSTLHNRNLCTSHYKKFLCKADQTSNMSHH